MGDELQWKVVREPKDVFFSFTPEQYAEQLVRESALLFRACSRDGFRDCRWQGKNRAELAGKLVESIAQFNLTSVWFTNMIVLQESLETRVAALQHVIQTAEVWSHPPASRTLKMRRGE